MSVRLFQLLAAIGLVGFGVSRAAGQAPAYLPSTDGKSLTGTEIRLPVSDRPQTFLIAGFTRGSSSAVKAWWLQAEELCRAHPAVACYKVAVLQDAPGFLRGSIINGLKRDLSSTEQDNFITIVENGAAWKHAFGFHASDDAYFAIFDDTGKVLWRAQGKEGEVNQAVIAKGFAAVTK